MARESQMSPSSLFSKGTLPVGEYCRIRSRLSGRPSGTSISSNAAPLMRRASQPRSDQDESLRLPITMVRAMRSLFGRPTRTAMHQRT